MSGLACQAESLSFDSPCLRFDLLAFNEVCKIWRLETFTKQLRYDFSALSNGSRLCIDFIEDR